MNSQFLRLTKTFSERRSFRRSLIFTCLLASVSAAPATTLYWLGNGNSSATREWNRLTAWSLNASGGGANQLPSAVSPGDDLVFGNYASSEALLNTRPTIGNYFANSMTFTCNGWSVFANTGTDKITLGAGGIIYNAGNVAGVSSAGPAAGPTQFRCLLDLGANATLFNGDLVNQLTIRQDATSYTAGNLSCVDLKTFTLTFDGPGTNVFNTVTVGTHAGGPIKGSGGIIKNGSGSTQFSATNTYTGPTVINAGQLVVKTWCAGGGSYTVADGANLQVTVGSAGTTLNTSSLNVTSTTTNSLTLGLSSFGNPTVPVIHATNLTLNGTIYVTITGSGFSPGTIPLIQYEGSVAGGGTLVTNSIPSGVGAYLTNNVAAKQFQLVVSSVPSLVWIGKTNATLLSTWDIAGNTNWLDTASGLPSAFANGLPVRFDDSGFTNLVFLATNVVPFSITVSNNAKTYTLTNDGVLGFQATPSAGLIKDGPGTLIVGTTNGYTSYTTIKQGSIKTTIANAIGRGAGQSGASLTNNGTLDMNGFSQNVGIMVGAGLITNSSSSAVTLSAQAAAVDGGIYSGRIDEGTSGGTITLNKSGGILTLTGNNNYSGGTHIVTGGAAATRWLVLGGNNVVGTGPIVFDINGTLTADASPRTLTNAISIMNINASFGIGSAGSGLLTCSGPVNNGSGIDQTLTIGSDVVFSGPVTSSSGGYTGKDGAGTLTYKNNTVTLLNVANDSRVSDGTLVIDGAAVTLVGAALPNFRVQSFITNGTASLVITNNGSLSVGNAFGYARLRLGDTSSAPGSTNIADIYGTLTASGITMGYTTTNNGGGGAFARLNLQSGSQLNIGQISAPSTNCRAITEVYFNGGTINVPDNASSSFLQGMTNAFVRSGGVTLNGANSNSIHIRQNLLNGGGGGGLTWNGTNEATLDATMLQLDGTNTYTGTTLINVGQLGGSGTLAGPLLIAASGELYPGGGGNLGTFIVNNNVTLQAGAHCSFELNTTNSLAQTDEFGVVTNYVPLANTNDMLVVSGSITATGASLSVNNDGPPLVLGNSFKLFSQPVSFTSVSLPPLDAGLAWQNNLAVNGSIQVVVPSATPPTLVVTQTGNTLNFTWTDASFHLQSQTNSLTAGLSGVWHDYPGGGTSGVNVTVNPANPTVFFRLSQ